MPPQRTAGEDEGFYASLPELENFVDVTDPARYAEVPSSWHVVVTDVRGSTLAIEAGRYRDVNALGVASIIGVTNALSGVELPFVFGGDGATLLVPGTRLETVRRALRGTRRLAQEAFSLGLRASIVSVADLLEAGHAPRVARFRASRHTTLAMFAGSAYSVAESWVKHPATGARYEVSADGPDDVDFSGFECRWQPLEATRGNTVSLLVTALSPDEAERVKTYRRVLEALQAIVDAELSCPVKATALRLTGPTGDFSIEARVRARATSGPAFKEAKRNARKATSVGKLLTLLGVSAGGFDGASYKREVVHNNDFRKFDETLRMVLDVSDHELSRVSAMLEAERGQGTLAYGTHRAGAALITCLVKSYHGEHLHFVDGADGGYALAAKQLKQQLAKASK